MVSGRWLCGSSAGQSVRPLIRGLLALLIVGGSDFTPVDAADARQVTQKIDVALRRSWEENGVQPAEPATDATFLRRVSLHLGGVIPPVSVTREFLADRSADKRARYVDRLLDGPEYLANFSEFWQRAMLPDVQSEFQQNQARNSFELWLQQRLAANTPYDELVRRILVPVEFPSQAVTAPSAQIAPSPTGFYSLRGSSPENFASGAVRVFLGVRLECAQCHDHPFDTWKQDQFWSMAAFFAPPGSNGQVPDSRWSIKVGGTERIVPAIYLDGTRPTANSNAEGRTVLVEWITSRENDRFAVTAVNRLWGHFFGVGLVDPVDDFSDNNPASHPELLQLLADEFVRSNYDLKFIIRAIVASEAYQLDSRQTHPSQAEVRLYGRMRAQGLTSSQVLANFRQANGQQLNPVLMSNDGRQFFRDGNNQQFDQLFSTDGSTSLEQATSILQALYLMNSQESRRATYFLSSQHALSAIVTNPFMSDDDRIDALYLLTLTRFPTETERKRVHDVFLTAAPKPPSSSLGATLAAQLRNLVQPTRPQPVTAAIVSPGKAGLADLFWVLLNCSEFQLNH